LIFPSLDAVDAGQLLLEVWSYSVKVLMLR
jgi:hypothetical protein